MGVLPEADLALGGFPPDEADIPFFEELFDLRGLHYILSFPVNNDVVVIIQVFHKRSHKGGDTGCKGLNNVYYLHDITDKVDNTIP